MSNKENPLEPLEVINPTNKFKPSSWWKALKSIKYLFDPTVSFKHKFIPIATIIYIITPIDLSPDFVPFLGQIDDIALILITMQIFQYLVEKNKN